MNILHWSECSLPDAYGGIEVFLSHLLQCQARRGHTIALVANTPSGAAPLNTPDGIAVHRIPFTAALLSRNPGMVTRTIDAVRIIKQRFQPDVIHCHSHTSGVFFHVRTRAAWKCPEVLTVHTLEQLGDPLGELQSQLYRGSESIACVSEFIRTAFRQVAPDLADVMSVVSNGSIPAIMPPAFPTANERKRLFIGCRLVEEKGVQHAIEAMPAILQSHPDATLTIAGDGNFRPALESLACSLGVAESVRFSGSQSFEEIQASLLASGIVLVPSLGREAFGIAAIEGAHARRPLILSATGGLAGLFADGTEARYVAPGCARAIAAAVCDLLDHPDLADSLATAAHQKAASMFSIEHAADAYDAIYVRLSPAKHKKPHNEHARLY